MMIVRPMGSKDLDYLLQLVLSSGHGLTSLPKDPDLLRERLKKSEASFTQNNPHKTQGPKGEDYLFGLEDLATGEIVGVSGIYSNAAAAGPIYLYEIREEERVSPELAITTTLKMLYPKLLTEEISEVCSLYLSPQHRKSSTGRFLSLVRFLFMADYKNCFASEVMAGMRGMVGDDGSNPFWEAVGKKFFHMPFTRADHLYVLSKQWIKDLFPEMPLCADLLPSRGPGRDRQGSPPHRSGG